MQINKFWSLGLVALALAGCSKDSGKGVEDDANDVNYLSINIVSNNAETKAPGDPTGAEYEEGLAAENAVNKVRFYFFRSNGDAANVVASSRNYYDWTPSDAAGNMPNVEKSLVATIVLQKVGVNGDNISESNFPRQVVAVLNPDYANLPAGNINLDTFRKVVKDYVASTGDPNGFVMCNSSYINESGTARVSTTTITEANVAKDPSTALANPVTIYVERQVAKVRVTFDNTVTIGTAVPAKDDKGNNIEYTVYNNVDGVWTPTTEKKQIYVKFTGWNLTATTEKGWLSKHIYATWTDALFGGMIWSWAPYHRSFWALNAPDAGQQYFKFNEIGNGQPWLYTNENAGDNTSNDDSNAYEREFPTQVIAAAQLVDEDGDALTICEYAGDRFIGEGNLVYQMANFASIYKKTVVAGEEHYTKISPADVELVTALANGSAETGQENHGRYFVELKLNEAHLADSDETVWTSSNIKGAATLTKEEVNAALKTVGHAKCWKTGLAYYYFPIRHLAPVPTAEQLADPDFERAGVYGVVRNHIYDFNITGVIGLGTPVYEPTETVWPEKPQPDNDTYIAAKINILSWRVVANDTPLSSY